MTIVSCPFGSVKRKHMTHMLAIIYNITPIRTKVISPASVKIKISFFNSARAKNYKSQWVYGNHLIPNTRFIALLSVVTVSRILI